jgi:hypothetical protein
MHPTHPKMKVSVDKMEPCDNFSNFRANVGYYMKNVIPEGREAKILYFARADYEMK